MNSARRHAPRAAGAIPVALLLAAAAAAAASLAGLHGAVAVPFGPFGNALRLVWDPDGLAFLTPGLLAVAADPPRAPAGSARAAAALLAIVAGEWATLAAAGAVLAVLSLRQGSSFGAGADTAAGGLAVTAVAVRLSGAAAAVPAIPGAAGAALALAAGAFAAVSAWRAARADTLPALARWLDRATAGGVGLALGVALVARGADQTGLAADALAAVSLLALGRAVAAVALARLVHAVAVAAGSVALDRLGGLAAGMPRTAWLAALAGLTLAGLPLGADFGGLWLLARLLGPLGRLQGVGGVALAGLFALAYAFRAQAVARAALTLLGRPRTPRGAAAEEIARDRARLPLAGALLLLGIWPGGVWRLLHWGVVVPAGLAALPLPGLALLMAGCAGAVALLRTRAPDLAAGGRRLGPAWRDGAAADPAWLPFGDPAAQTRPDALAGPALPPLPALRWRIWSDAASPRWALIAAAVALAAVALAAVALT